MPHGLKSGAVMIFAVILMTAGVFVLAAVLQTAATQGVSGETEWVAVERRVMLANSRAMARQYLLDRVFRAPQSDVWGVSFTNSFGGFTNLDPRKVTDNFWKIDASANSPKVNPFNLMERGGFYREIFDVELVLAFTNELVLTGPETSAWRFALRTRSPVAAGFGLILQRPVTADPQNPPEPYIDMRAPARVAGFTGLPRVPFSSVTSVVNDSNGYQGYFDVPVYLPDGKWTNFDTNNVTYSNRGDNTLQVILHLGKPDPYDPSVNVLRYDIPNDIDYDLDGDGTNELTDITQIVLEGSGRGGKPLLVDVSPTATNADSLQLAGDNDRSVYFRLQRNGGATFAVAAMPGAESWILGLTIMGCPTQFELEAVEIAGGLRADGNVKFQSGSFVNFYPTNNNLLDSVADRVMWLEDYR